MRLGDVVFWWPAVGDCAVGAVAGADVAEDHERGCAMFPALADVGAVRFLAHGMQVELTHQVLEPHIVGAARRPYLEPRRFSPGERLGAVTPHDLIESIWHLFAADGEERVRLANGIYIKSGRGEIVTSRG